MLVVTPRVDVQRCAPDNFHPGSYEILLGLNASGDEIKWKRDLTVAIPNRPTFDNLFVAGASLSGIIITSAPGAVEVLSPSSGESIAKYNIKQSLESGISSLVFCAAYDANSKSLFGYHSIMTSNISQGVLIEYTPSSSRELFRTTFFTPVTFLGRLLGTRPMKLSDAAIEQVVILGRRYLLFSQSDPIRGGPNPSGITIYDRELSQFVFQRDYLVTQTPRPFGKISIAGGSSNIFGTASFVPGKTITDPDRGYYLETYQISGPN